MDHNRWRRKRDATGIGQRRCDRGFYARRARHTRVRVAATNITMFQVKRTHRHFGLGIKPKLDLFIIGPLCFYCGMHSIGTRRFVRVDEAASVRIRETETGEGEKKDRESRVHTYSCIGWLTPQSDHDNERAAG